MGVSRFTSHERVFMRSLPLCIVVCALVLLCTGQTLRAWGPQGHMMVAYVAWQELSPADKKACSEILDALPHKEDSIERGMPQGLNDEKRNMFRFTPTGPEAPLPRHGDSPPGFSGGPATAAKRAEEWRSNPELSRDAFKSEILRADYTDWMDESVKAARDTAYDGGRIHGANEE